MAVAPDGLCDNLLGNAKAAVAAALEIYNKPTFSYRDECVSMLLLNAWELTLKALLVQNEQSIFLPNEPKKTISWRKALEFTQHHFPDSVPYMPVSQNLRLLGTYRNQVSHFYLQEELRVVLYALFQTSIKNLRDLIEGAFGIRLEDEFNWSLLPIGIRPPVDAVAYLTSASQATTTAQVRGFIDEIMKATKNIRQADEDTGRLLTVFNVKLESVRKIGDADVVVGITKEPESSSTAFVRSIDPNKTHPLRQKEIVEKIGCVGERKFTSYDFQAIVRKYGIKDKPQYCWKAEVGMLVLYSLEIVTFIRGLSIRKIDAARLEYRTFLRSKSVEQ